MCHLNCNGNWHFTCGWQAQGVPCKILTREVRGQDPEEPHRSSSQSISGNESCHCRVVGPEISQGVHSYKKRCKFFKNNFFQKPWRERAVMKLLNSQNKQGQNLSTVRYWLKRGSIWYVVTGLWVIIHRYFPKNWKWAVFHKENVSCAGGTMSSLILEIVLTNKVRNSPHISGEESMLTFGGASVARLITWNKVLSVLPDKIWNI